MSLSQIRVIDKALVGLLYDVYHQGYVDGLKMAEKRLK